jgi:hypothetical protein
MEICIRDEDGKEAAYTSAPEILRMFTQYFDNNIALHYLTQRNIANCVM